MKTTDIDKCEYFERETEEGFHEEGLTQWERVCDGRTEIFHMDAVVTSIQRCEGATGVIVNYVDDKMFEVMDDEDLELEVYKYSHTL